MAGLALVVFLLVRSANCAFFDLTDVDDPLSLLWHTKDSITPPKSSCSVILDDGTSITGTCKHKAQCLLSGGQVHFNGQCGFFTTCCTQKTDCSRKTRSKVSHFTNPDSIVTECEYVVEAENDNICQMRIDFETFQLSPSERRPLPPINPTNQVYHRICRADFLTITPKTYYTSEYFCGNNDNQHVYVHLNKQRQVTLHMHLANRNLTQDPNVIPNPRWKIKITQLECPGLSNFFTKHKNFNAQTDFKLLAPEGATQYFMAQSGRIRSFGFDGATQSEYISGLNYSIAFKINPRVNCIRFTTNYITLRQSLETADPGFCIDYLFIPELVTETTDVTNYDSKVCSRLVTVPQTPQIFYSHGPGPFLIHFVSQTSFTEAPLLNLVHAFDINYEITSCN
ncbi:uncharacterized protein LOC103313654 [Tribolium castaneum]|uniref:CUB domain-containing protein n=1 Tax=Tribolium castaneum TaxID=7070 RepID=A0A139WF54_TRICA|nr:PREDICTED: uncharacterized protein LOC103313654 [Tribolium castaneum]KYB26501.1 hypothetical protein TcasGA2_TC033726 [Tribolium castaneum]|eukprot:XP_008195717.1 PREDICTED: uncharacterized protein LOC103313654 [Tribolium castaneum]